jgi:MoaA/NifB/PqqE/SkfB family radical SAM enzyme
VTGLRGALGGLAHTLYYDLPARWLGGFVLPVRNVTLELTYRCNLTCDFCYLRVEEEKLGRVVRRKEELHYEEIRTLLADLPRRSNVTFVGGEVTIKDRFWELVAEATQRHRVTIGTNAVMFTPEICDRIVALGVRAVGTSLDGPEDVHDAIRGRGNFARTCENVRRIVARRRDQGMWFPRVNVNCVMIPENLGRLVEVVDTAAALGADSCGFQVLDPSLNRSGINLRDDIATEEPWPKGLPAMDRAVFAASLDAVERRAREHSMPTSFVPLKTKAEVLDFYAGRFDYARYGCGVPWTTLRVSPTGDVFPCLNYRIGNVRDASLNTLWNHPRYRAFRNGMRGPGLYQSCAGCCKMTPRTE